MFTFGYLFSRMSWLNKCFHRYFSQYLSLYEVFNVHSLRKAKPLEVSSKLLYQSTFISNAFGSGQLHSFMFLTEWRWRDSNSWPPACKAGALPTELHPHLEYSKFSFSSSPYLDVSVQAVPFHTLWIGVWMHEVCSCGFPHSDICGSVDICSSPQLFAAYHVFHRLLVPRHPPCALFCLTSLLPFQ